VATVLAPVATVFAPVAVVFAAVQIDLSLSIKALSLLSVLAICYTPFIIAIALCTFNIAYSTFSFSLPNNPITPVATVAAAVIP
jgi:hypothetical protein